MEDTLTKISKTLRTSGLACAACILTVVAFGTSPSAQAQEPVTSPSASRVRIYYIAADEVDWDYAPGGVNKMMGMKFDRNSALFTERGPHRIGTVYRKAIYREYTDQTFQHLKPRPPQWEHAGILGPILRAEVGDTIRVVFKNNATQPYSMHPHGVFYDKASEGAPYADGTSGADKADDAELRHRIDGAEPRADKTGGRCSVKQRAAAARSHLGDCRFGGHQHGA